MPRHSLASCFATYLLPHVLFVAGFEERERIARVCCLVWNIGLFPHARERARHFEGDLSRHDVGWADRTMAGDPGGYRSDRAGDVKCASLAALAFCGLRS